MMSGKYTSIDAQQLQGSVPAVPDSRPATVNFADSNLQTFPPSGPLGKITAASGPPRDADDCEIAQSHMLSSLLRAESLPGLFQSVIVIFHLKSWEHRSPMSQAGFVKTLNSSCVSHPFPFTICSSCSQASSPSFATAGPLSYTTTAAQGCHRLRLCLQTLFCELNPVVFLADTRPCSFSVLNSDAHAQPPLFFSPCNSHDIGSRIASECCFLNLPLCSAEKPMDSFSKPVSGSDEPQQGGWFQTFTIAAYKPYFDVDTSDVLERIIDSLFPFRGSFNEKTATNPDLYGPFWICTTLIFVAASIGTFVTYVAHKLKSKEWDYDINLVTWSAGLFYGYVTIVPLCLYVILKYFSAPAGLVQLFCLYGYSLFVFIPALCMSVVPLDIFRWVVAGVAGFMSATFVALNLRAHIKSAGERWFLIVAGIFLLQLALAVVLKIYLFTVSV
ncbi:Protein YIPF1-like [Glycine soja]|uniref:Protein YIPF1-like n=1 Tax=Glycine soja TaxID=3848 RepID=A0A445FKX2_GLYSO|nr:Protein YIPF1-like [Glycine soja]